MLGHTRISEDSSEIAFLLVENYNYDRSLWSSDRMGIFGNYALSCYAEPTFHQRASFMEPFGEEHRCHGYRFGLRVMIGEFRLIDWVTKHKTFLALRGSPFLPSMARSVIVTGATGFLGHQVLQVFERAGWHAVGTGFSRATSSILKVNLADQTAIGALLGDVR